MRFFELDIDENQVRRLVRVIIDKYESGIRDHGSHQRAVEAAQEQTVQSLEDAAEFVDEITEITGTLH